MLLGERVNSGLARGILVQKTEFQIEKMFFRQICGDGVRDQFSAPFCGVILAVCVCVCVCGTKT